ncbi:hypothetical protein AX14_011845 [Amanita brunnescens Koide BX004]|nr:hypothetical protein AX14_011845 [Amanita brunnescens Koide BX004]
MAQLNTHALYRFLLDTIMRLSLFSVVLIVLFNFTTSVVSMGRGTHGPPHVYPGSDGLLFKERLDTLFELEERLNAALWRLRLDTAAQEKVDRSFKQGSKTQKSFKNKKIFYSSTTYDGEAVEIIKYPHSYPLPTFLDRIEDSLFAQELIAWTTDIELCLIRRPQAQSGHSILEVHT